jgi:hypothetical protein
VISLVLYANDGAVDEAAVQWQAGAVLDARPSPVLRLATTFVFSSREAGTGQTGTWRRNFLEEYSKQ